MAIQYISYSMDFKEDVFNLLKGCELPIEDLTPSMIEGFILAVEGAELRGCGGIQYTGGSSGLVRSIAVAPELRGGGVGWALLSMLETHARQMDIQHLYLLTTTAAFFFEKHGYHRIARDNVPKEIAETEEFSSICPASATVMCKKLSCKIE